MSIRFGRGYFIVDFDDHHRDAPLRKLIPDLAERKKWKANAKCGNVKLFSRSPNKGLAQVKLNKLLRQYPNNKDCFYIADMMDIHF